MPGANLGAVKGASIMIEYFDTGSGENIVSDL
jgi:hypothetical protein